MLFVGLAVLGIALIVRAGRQRRPGWLLVVGALLMGSGRVADSPWIESAALAVILIGLALTARPGRGPAPARRWTLGASVALVGAALLAFAPSALSSTHHQSRFLVTHKHLRVDLSGGDVTLRRGTGADLVVNRTTHRGTVEPRVRETSAADGVRITAECGGRLNFACAVSYDIEVPDGFDLDIELGAGSLDAHDLVVGALDVRVASGDVALAGVSAASTVVEVASGDLRLDFAAPPGRVVATVSSGHIQIGLPTRTYDVEADSAAGDERVEVPVDPASAFLIRARTSHGDIALVANSSR